MSLNAGDRNGAPSSVPSALNAPLYDRIGVNYRATRRADRRIVGELLRLLALPVGSLVCEIGAGCGNYSTALADVGLAIMAVEPSRTMRQQAVDDSRVTWLEGVAEQLPLAETTVDGIVSILAMHHFGELDTAFSEMQRVCPRGPWVFFTLDPRLSEQAWIYDYFPEIRAKELVVFPELSALASSIERKTRRDVAIDRFELPCDLTDQFLNTAWARPERYLDPVFRQNTSGFATADATVVAAGVVRLREDLRSGAWDQKYRALRSQATFDAGFRFLTVRRRERQS
jgi:ubiquinone/menaquinone biosynthesis C-methylase UbiE